MSRQCIDAGLERGEFGIWGGTSERERRKLRKRGGSSGPCPRCGLCFTWKDRFSGRARDYCGHCLTYFDVLEEAMRKGKVRPVDGGQAFYARGSRKATVQSSGHNEDGLEDTA